MRSEVIQTNSRSERFDRETLRSREKSSRDRHCLSSSSFFRENDDSTSNPRGLERCNDARIDMSLEMSRNAMCVQRFDDSLNSAIHIIYRISLRFSSMSKSKDSLLKVLSHSKACLERHFHETDSFESSTKNVPEERRRLSASRFSAGSSSKQRGSNDKVKESRRNKNFIQIYKCIIIFFIN